MTATNNLLADPKTMSEMDGLEMAQRGLEATIAAKEAYNREQLKPYRQALDDIEILLSAYVRIPRAFSTDSVKP